MQPQNTGQNGCYRHWVVVRQESPGQFTAQVVGLPEMRALAATRDEAIQQVRTMLKEWLVARQLVAVEVASENSCLALPEHTDPNDPLEQEFLKDLERFRQEDLERTLREYELEDQQCSKPSSTPTT